MKALRRLLPLFDRRKAKRADDELRAHQAKLAELERRAQLLEQTAKVKARES